MNLVAGYKALDVIFLFDGVDVDGGSVAHSIMLLEARIGSLVLLELLKPDNG